MRTDSKIEFTDPSQMTDEQLAAKCAEMCVQSLNYLCALFNLIGVLIIRYKNPSKRVEK